MHFKNFGQIWYLNSKILSDPVAARPADGFARPKLLRVKMPTKGAMGTPVQVCLISRALGLLGARIAERHAYPERVRDDARYESITVVAQILRWYHTKRTAGRLLIKFPAQ